MKRRREDNYKGQDNFFEQGFTLVEIAVAILILGISLTTVFTIQTRYVDQYIDEYRNAKAALYARYIMAMIEVDKEAPKVGADQGKLSELLRTLHYFEIDDASESEQAELEGWQFQKQVSSIDIPGFGSIEIFQDVMRRVDLNISWGGGARESFQVIFYRKTRKT